MNPATLPALFQQFTGAASTDSRISAQFTAWSQARRRWRSHWTNRGAVSEQTLQLFVPSPAPAASNTWVHPIADEAPEIDAWRSLWNTAPPGERRELAAAIVRAIEQIEKAPASTAEACAALARAAGQYSVPLAALTPALSSLDPNRFVAICDAWLRPLGEYEGTPMKDDVTAYHEVNAVALRWLAAAEGDAPAQAFAGYPPADRFGVFCGWAVRKSSDAPQARFDVTKKKYKDWPPMW